MWKRWEKQGRDMGWFSYNQNWLLKSLDQIAFHNIAKTSPCLSQRLEREMVLSTLMEEFSPDLTHYTIGETWDNWRNEINTYLLISFMS